MNATPQKIRALPRGDQDDSQDEPPLATARWLSTGQVMQAMKAGAAETWRSPVLLGQLWERDVPHRFVSADDRHLVTIAGSRSGKGRSLILPNLLSYPGSVVCIDPKGENAAVTARYRRDTLGQNVVILDPFNVLAKRGDLADLRGGFNPFEWVNADATAVDDVAALADALIVRDNDRDPHWNESARAFLKGIMLFVMSLPTYTYADDDAENGEPTGVNWSLDFVRRLVSVGLSKRAGRPPSLDGLLKTMQESDGFDGAVSAAGHLIAQMGENERGGVLSNLRRHTEFLESKPIAECLASSDFDPSKIAVEPTTVYLVLPEWRMGTHARWLRVVITSLMQGLQRAKRAPGGHATLFVLDEFATLGHMESIERAAGYIAGFGVKLWLIVQDLNQLKSLYADRWETFLGNAGALTAFGNADVTTLQYLSQRLGATEVVRTLIHTSHQHGSSENRSGVGQAIESLSRGRVAAAIFGQDSENTQSGFSQSATPGLHQTALITPDEIARHFSRESEMLIVHLSGQQPFRLNRIQYERDEPFCSRADPSPYHPTVSQASAAS